MPCLGARPLTEAPEQSGTNGGGLFISTLPPPAPGGAASEPIVKETLIYNSTSWNGGCLYVEYAYVGMSTSRMQFCTATQPGAGRGGAVVSEPQPDCLHALS